MTRFLTTSVLLLVLTTLPDAYGQSRHEHQHHHHDLRPRPPAAPVQYRLAAELLPDSQAVRGQIECEILNDTEAPFGRVVFECPEPVMFEYGSSDTANDSTAARPQMSRVDSILFRGVPIGTDGVIVEAGRLVVILPDPIPPGQRAFFLIGFTTRLDGAGVDRGDGMIALSRWFPRASETIHNTKPRALGPADYRATLSLDTTWALACPGELLNAKELFGPLPAPPIGSVYVDLHTNYRFEYQGRTYEPTFEGGRRRYHLWMNRGQSLPLLLAPELRVDRAMADSATVEVYYPPELAERWEREIASRTASIVAYYRRWISSGEADRIAIAPGAGPDPGTSWIWLPEDETDLDLLTVLQAKRLVRVLGTEADKVALTFCHGGYTDCWAALALRQLWPERARGIWRTYLESEYSEP